MQSELWLRGHKWRLREWWVNEVVITSSFVQYFVWPVPARRQQESLIPHGLLRVRQALYIEIDVRKLINNPLRHGIIVIEPVGRLHIVKGYPITSSCIASCRSNLKSIAWHHVSEWREDCWDDSRCYLFDIYRCNNLRTFDSWIHNRKLKYHMLFSQWDVFKNWAMLRLLRRSSWTTRQ